MKAKIKFLIHICNLENGYKFAECTSIKIISELYLSSEEAINDLIQKLSLFLENEAQLYISNHQGNEEIVNCPEGKCKQPIDVWYCKLSDKICPTQAQVFLVNKDEFLSKCLADERKKNDIFDIIIKGKYNGAHHVIGRYLCPLCDNKSFLRENDKYHYYFELYSLEHYFDVFNYKFRKDFLLKRIDRRAYYSLCSECFMETVSKIDSNKVQEFIIKEMDYYYE